MPSKYLQQHVGLRCSCDGWTVCFCLICCSETVSFDVWSCHVELEGDCRLVGRWFGRTVSGRVHSQEINMDRDLQ